MSALHGLHASRFDAQTQTDRKLNENWKRYKRMRGRKKNPTTSAPLMYVWEKIWLK